MVPPSARSLALCRKQPTYVPANVTKFAKLNQFNKNMEKKKAFQPEEVVSAPQVEDVTLHQCRNIL